MPNYNKLKKKLRTIRADFEDNDYYTSYDSVITTDIYKESELETINIIAELIGLYKFKDNPKTRLKKPYGLFDIALANGMTIKELNEHVLSMMAFVRDIQ